MRKICFIGRMAIAALVAVLSLSCADKTDVSYDGAEARSLEEWIRLNRPDLLANYQSDGGYYVELLERGDAASEATADTLCWVRFDFTGRDLAGNVCLTREEMIARQIGSFTRFTHYVPFYRYSGTSAGSLLDGIHLALRNPLLVDDEEVLVRKGTELRIYMPSTVIGASGLGGSGGYEGQEFGGTSYSLSSNRPMIVRMKVTDIIKNPIEAEGTQVDAFAEENGGLLPPRESEITPARRGRLDEETPSTDDDYAWRTVTAGDDQDTLPQLYVSRTYAPSLKADSLLKYRNTYISSTTPFNNPTELDRKINQALIDRFGYGTLEGDTITLTGTAKIWYIGRFLDGFIFDTNIDEVKKLIYENEDDGDEGSAISYNPTSNQSSYVSAWYYSIPHMQYGQWAAIVGTSTYFYGATGKEGSTSTSSSGSSSVDYTDMLNYYNYMNSMYGNSGYGGYYNNYYDSYYGGYYGNYGYSTDTSGTSTTVTSVSTEIQSYTPLLFQIFIEAQDE